MRSSDWSSDVCSSDLQVVGSASLPRHPMTGGGSMIRLQTELLMLTSMLPKHEAELYTLHNDPLVQASIFENILQSHADVKAKLELYLTQWRKNGFGFRSEEHTSELQSLMRISYAVFCLKKKKRSCIK